MRHEFSPATNHTCSCHGWTRAKIVEDLPQQEQLPLVGLAEIAMAAGVHKASVAMWRTKQAQTYFPDPVARVGNASVWWWPDVQEWLLATGRRDDAGYTAEQILGGPSQHRNRAEWKAALELGREAARKLDL